MRYTLLVLFSAFFVTACGSGGDSNGNDEEVEEVNVPVARAYFFDSVVEGLEYSSDSYQGITDSNGGFLYQPSEAMTFSFKGLILGSLSTAANSTSFTPLDLFGTSDVNHQAVRNTLVMLQTLDADQNPANGIALPSASDLIDISALDISASDFQSRLLPSLAAFKSSLQLVPEQDAIDHFSSTLIRLNAKAEIEGRWLMRDTTFGDFSAVYHFNANNTLEITEFEDCANNDTYWAANENSAERNCSGSGLNFDWELDGSNLTMTGVRLDDHCTIISSTLHLIEAVCEFEGSGLGDELVRFERDVTDPTRSLENHVYSEFVGGSLNYADYSSVNSGMPALLEAVAGAYTINGGTQVLIPDFVPALADDLLGQQVWGVYDAVNGQCKAVYNFNVYVSSEGVPLAKYGNAGDNPDHCEIPPDGLELPQLPLRIDEYSASVDNGALVFERDGEQEICWPVAISKVSEGGDYAVVACSTNGSAFDFELWRNLHEGESSPYLHIPVESVEDEHVIPKSGPPGLRQTLAVRIPMDANIHEIRALMRNGTWPESACLNFIEAGFYYPMALNGSEGAWTKVENAHVYDLPDQGQKIVKAEFVNWSHCNTRYGKLLVDYSSASADFGSLQDADGSWTENWISFQPGNQVCEDRGVAVNCEMIGDSGMWRVGEYQGQNIEYGEYLNSVEIIRDTVNGNRVKLTPLENPRVNNNYFASLIKTFHGIPVTPDTELFFNGYEDRLREDFFVSIYVSHAGSHDGNDPCKSKKPVYVFGNDSFDPGVYPPSNPYSEAIIIGATSSFRRNIFQDLDCAESEYEIGTIVVDISHGLSDVGDLGLRAIGNQVTLGSIGITR